LPYFDSLIHCLKYVTYDKDITPTIYDINRIVPECLHGRNLENGSPPIPHLPPPLSLSPLLPPLAPPSPHTPVLTGTPSPPLSASGSPTPCSFHIPLYGCRSMPAPLSLPPSPAAVESATPISVCHQASHCRRCVGCARVVPLVTTNRWIHSPLHR
jgi:hypothetical protein